MSAPDERDRFGAVPREAVCHVCPHPHHILPCDSCLCEHDIAPGLD